MKFNQLTAFLCAAAMLGACAPAAAAPMTVCAADELQTSAATSGVCGDNLTWEYNRTTHSLNIRGTGPMYSWDKIDDIPWWQCYLYYGSAPASVNISSGVTSIGTLAFAGHADIDSIKIPDTVTSIGECAFLGCTDLTSVTIPKSVTEWGPSCFYKCSSLRSITFEDGLTTIGECAFMACTSIEKVTIPASVTKVGTGAFLLCSGLTGVEVSPDNTAYSSVDGILFSKNQNVLIYYPNKAGASYVIPDTVLGISGFAFSDCVQLKDVTIPQQVFLIGEGAFSSVSETGSSITPRTDLTLHVTEGSKAESYAKENNLTYQATAAEDPPAAQPKVDPYTLGDPTGDGSINAEDATMILVAAARIGTGGESGLTSQEFAAADIDSNNAINAMDATAILRFAAAMGTGTASDIRDYT